jgi:hypothetical protein
MKKKLRAIYVFIILLSVKFNVFAASSSSVAGGASTISGSFKIPNPTKFNSLEDIINTFTPLILPGFILLMGGLIVYAGAIRMTSKGDPEKVKQSTQIITAAIGGFVIALILFQQSHEINSFNFIFNFISDFSTENFCGL